jgi:iron-sulfur cluster assembly accessory protein
MLKKAWIFSNNKRFFATASSAYSLKRKPTKAILTVSPSASLRIAKLLSLTEAQRPLGIRIGINKRGCNGLNYTMKYVQDDDDGRSAVSKDEVIILADKISIYIDPRAVFAIVGSVMDWKDNELTSEFTFINPNAKGFCGCGESFNVK